MNQKPYVIPLIVGLLAVGTSLISRLVHIERIDPIPVDLSMLATGVGVVRIEEVGSHGAVLRLVDRREDFWPRPSDSLSFALTIRVEAAGRETIERLVDRGDAYYRSGYEGIWLTTFEVPEDIPRNADVKITIVTSRPDPSFEATYGRVELMIWKLGGH